jgi:hypothetical protein
MRTKFHIQMLKGRRHLQDLRQTDKQAWTGPLGEISGSHGGEYEDVCLPG